MLHVSWQLKQRGQNTQFAPLKMSHSVLLYLCGAIDRFAHSSSVVVGRALLDSRRLSGETEREMEKRHCAGVDINLPFIRINAV